MRPLMARRELMQAICGLEEPLNAEFTPSGPCPPWGFSSRLLRDFPYCGSTLPGLKDRLAGLAESPRGEGLFKGLKATRGLELCGFRGRGYGARCPLMDTKLLGLLSPEQ